MNPHIISHTSTRLLARRGKGRLAYVLLQPQITTTRSTASLEYELPLCHLSAAHRTQNEDCGQMSAWWLFSALGFYPVNPSSTLYVVGSPFFDKVTIAFPGTRRRLVIRAPGASKKTYVRSLTLNGKTVGTPVLSHKQIAGGGEMVFEMSETPQSWGSGGAMPHHEL